MTDVRSGYTLPVFACAAAIAALQKLRPPHSSSTSVSLDLVEPAQTVEIPIEQVALVQPGMALAIARSDPGDNLDLTRDTPIWAVVEWTQDQTEAIVLQGGEGIGRVGDQAAIYAYAKRVVQANLQRLLAPGETIRVTIILPEGQALALRTSNAAFGVVEGLSLLGSSGISQPLSAPGQLEAFRADLQAKATQFDQLVFCIGENGLDFAQRLGIAPERLVKTANWLGPLLVEAGLQSVKSLLLLGYHGKLVKLAGGIFHTHHHVADGRQEIFTAYCAQAGLPTADLQTVLACETVEAALTHLRSLSGTWVDAVYGAIAQQIDQRSQQYIFTHSQQRPQVGCLLFDRRRQVICTSETGTMLLSQIC